MSQETEQQKIEKIEGLSVQAGLDRVFGQWPVYKKSLKLSIKEVEICDENLNKFLSAGDMRNFAIQAHSMKGLLANIGAFELSALALELENASNRKDTAFCASALNPFLKVLHEFGDRLEEIFPEEEQYRGPIEIPPELPLIFKKLEAALNKADFLAIDKEMESIDALNLANNLKEEIEKIQDAVMMMDYDGALEVIRKLLKQQDG
jgi:HPt (histidine-containing phosphotransfer) domain-containing protein